MDIRMPVMDGREATRRIKAEPGGTETVIVALTASSYEEEREEILACGCDDFLRKPFQEEALFELMERRLGVRFEYQAAHDPALKGEEQASEAALEALAALPRGLRESLCGALDRLDVNAIEHQIGAVTTCDAALGHTLTTMAVRFEYEALAKMLRDSAQSDRG
jgi:CheY-like chemotaxis protein